MPAMRIPTTRSVPALTRDITMTDTPAEVAEALANLSHPDWLRVCAHLAELERQLAEARAEADKLRALRKELRRIVKRHATENALLVERLAERDAQLAAQRERDGRDAELWRAHIAGGCAHSHRCKRCNLPYTPAPNQSEDCPGCGYDGGNPSALKDRP